MSWDDVDIPPPPRIKLKIIVKAVDYDIWKEYELDEDYDFSEGTPADIIPVLEKFLTDLGYIVDYSYN